MGDAHPCQDEQAEDAESDNLDGGMRASGEDGFGEESEIKRLAPG